VRACIIVLVSLSAQAYPTVPPRPIADAIAGPADPNVGASYMNPAALGPLHGVHFWMEAGPNFHLGSIQINGTSGGQPRPGSTSVNYTDFNAFIGATWDLGTEYVTLGLSSIVPFADLGSFGNGATKFSSINQIWVTYQQSLALSGKLSNRFFVGVGFNIAESWMQWRFARDATLAHGANADPVALCGGPSCDQTIRLRGFGLGLGFSVGVLGRATDRLWLAASYISHFFTPGGGDEVILTDERGTRIDGPGVVCFDASGKTTPCVGNSRTSIYIPDILQAAARFEVNPKMEIEATLRWVHWSERSQLDWTAQGGNLGQVPPALLPAVQNRVDFGLQDTFGAELSLRLKVHDKLRLMPSLFFETSSVSSTAVMAAALDAPKLDFTLVAEWRPIKHLMLGAHAGATAFLMRDIDSRQLASNTTTCVDKNFDLHFCGTFIDGDGLPSQSGRYTLFTVHLGAGIGLDY
jgi:long-subunit fatty acid transport protein